MSAHVRRIEAVEKDLKALKDASASRDDISRIRAEVKKLYDGLHLGEPVYQLVLNMKVNVRRTFGSTDTCLGNTYVQINYRCLLDLCFLRTRSP